MDLSLVGTRELMNELKRRYDGGVVHMVVCNEVVEDYEYLSWGGLQAVALADLAHRYLVQERLIANSLTNDFGGIDDG